MLKIKHKKMYASGKFKLEEHYCTYINIRQNCFKEAFQDMRAIVFL